MSNNVYNSGQPIFSRININNPETVTEVNGNNINLQRLPITVERNDIFGANDAIDTTERILAPNVPIGGTVDISFPTTDFIMQIASTSTEDVGVTGTGARTVTIFGLDIDYNSISEEITMNGTTPVSTTLSFLRIQESVCTTVGSEDTNVGNIYVTDIGDTFVGGEPQTRCYDSMNARDGFSKTATFTVPAGKVLLHQIFDLQTDATGNNRIICQLKTQGDINNIAGLSISDKYYIESSVSIRLDNTRRRIPKQDIWLTIQAIGQTVGAHARLTTITSNTQLGERNLL